MYMNARRPLMAGNWKMYKTCEQAVDTARQLIESVDDGADVDILIAPPFTALAPVSDAIKGTSVMLGAQNLHFEKEGAYTGEISAAMLKSAGCSHVIIGHSERRQFFHETDDIVNQKVLAAIRQGLVPILCIGETEAERESGKTFSVLDKQVSNRVKKYSL
jgi:triosephosphate isomerase